MHAETDAKGVGESSKVDSKNAEEVNVESKTDGRGKEGTDGVSEARLKYLETLKNGLVDDDAWKNLYKYAEKNDIDLETKLFDWKLQKVEEFKSKILVDEDLMSVMQDKANNLLELSDNRLSDAMTSGYSAEDYSPNIAKERVRIRVLKGGHGIPKEAIERRYYESLENLKALMPVCDEINMYDNTKKIEEMKGKISYSIYK